jgi:hypothetical protein
LSCILLVFGVGLMVQSLDYHHCGERGNAALFAFLSAMLLTFYHFAAKL